MIITEYSLKIIICVCFSCQYHVCFGSAVIHCSWSHLIPQNVSWFLSFLGEVWRFCGETHICPSDYPGEPHLLYPSFAAIPGSSKCTSLVLESLTILTVNFCIDILCKFLRSCYWSRSFFFCTCALHSPITSKWESPKH